MKKFEVIKYIGLTLGIALSIFAVNSVIHANWTAPLHSPPDCPSGEPGCDPPVHVGTSAQIKPGSFGVGGVFQANSETLLAVSSGNVGIGTNLPGSKLTINGAIEHLGNPRYYRNLASAVVARWEGDPGTVKIRMPKSWSNTMMQIRIQGYDYSGIGAWEVVVAGYNFAGGGGTWLNVSADIRGSAPFNQVRLGHDGTRNVVLLGNTGTTWRKGAITVSEFIATWSNLDNWGEGWSISRITSEAGIGSIRNVPIYKYITPTGNVGIGDTTPDSKLDVEGGDIRISTAERGLIFPDGTKQTTAPVGVNLHGWSFADNFLRDDGQNVIQASDSWLRLNQEGHFVGGVHIPSRLNVNNRVDATIFYDNNNPSFFLDPSSTSLSMHVAGNIIASEPTLANHVATKGYVSAQIAGGEKTFYVTGTTHQGNTASTACAAGYRMCRAGEWVARRLNENLNASASWDNPAWYDAAAINTLWDCWGWTDNRQGWSGTTIKKALFNHAAVTKSCSEFHLVLCCSI